MEISLVDTLSSCFAHVLTGNYNVGNSSSRAAECYPLCTDIQYSTVVTSTTIQVADDNWQFPDGSYARWYDWAVLLQKSPQ